MEQRDPVEFWLGLAADDLAQAKRLAEHPPFPPGVCFHAQQAVEKALKAYLCFLGLERIPRTHDLVALLELAPTEAQKTFDQAALEKLTAYAVATRYGEVAVSADDATRALEEAAKVVEAVARRARAAGMEPPSRQTPNRGG